MVEKPENLVRLRVLIDGRVQGVGFRYFVQEKADQLQLKGWVRNTYGGQVEVCAEGPKGKLDLLLGYLRQGPRVALVTDVQIDWQPPSGEFTRFSIIPSY